MKHNKIFSERINCNNPDEVFTFLISTLKDTINITHY